MEAQLLKASHVDVHNIALEAWPYPDPSSGVTIEGEPTFEGHILWKSDDGREAVGIERVSPCVMRGTHVEEASYFIEGRVTIRPREGDPFEVTGGQLCRFPAGLETEWTIHETMLKVFHLRGDEPLGF